jgi:hypothetical protein
MKVLFFSSHVLWASHYETELEIITDLVAEGNEIIQVHCNAQLPNCDLNPFMELGKCNYCLAKQKNGFDLLKGDIKQITLPAINESDKKKISEIQTTFTNLKELKSLRIDSFELGIGIINSLVAITRDPNPSLLKYGPTLKNYIIGSAGIYYSFLKMIEDYKPDRVYVFSGRFAHTQAVFSACKESKTDCFIHERGSDLFKYSITENSTITDLDYNYKAILSAWENADETTRLDLGAQFYTNRRKGIIQNWYSFTKDHVTQYPDNWNPNKRNILILHSSDDELSTAWHNDSGNLFTDQISAIRAIGEYFNDQNELHFYLRIHPNFKSVNSPIKAEMYALDYNCFTIIPAESNISTYFLMDSCEKSISFGSTAGIEATMWDKPSILVGSSFYKGLGSTYEPSSPEKLFTMIKSYLNPLPKAGALKYGYYMETFGIPFKYFKSIDIVKGLFNGKEITDTPPMLTRLYQKCISLSPKLSARLREKRVLKSRSLFS